MLAHLKKFAVAQPQRVYSTKLAKSHHAWKIQAALRNLGILKLPSVWINQQWWCTTGRVAESGQTYKPSLEQDTPLSWSCFWLHWSAPSLFCYRSSVVAAGSIRTTPGFTIPQR